MAYVTSYDDRERDELVKAIEEEEQREETQRYGTTSNAIVNELVKSYGFSRTPEGDWGWDTDTIVKSFKEDPLWTTLDYAVLALGPLRFGTAFAKVGKGVGGAGKAFKGGKMFKGEKGSTFLGKTAQRLGADPEQVYATEMRLRGPSEFGRGFFSNPITTRIDDDYLRTIDRYGAEPWEKRGIARAKKVEQLTQEGMMQRTASDLIRQWDVAGLAAGPRARAMKWLGKGVSPDDARIQHQLGEQGAEAYKQTYDFRNLVHQEAFDTGLISEEVYLANLGKYNPRIYQEWEEVSKSMEALRSASPVVPGKAALSGRLPGTGVGSNRFMQSKYDRTPSHLTDILDPAVTLDQLGRAGMVIAKQKYAQGIAKSILAKDPGEVAMSVANILALKDPKLAAMLGRMKGVNSGQVTALRALDKSWKAVRKQGMAGTAVEEEIAHTMGWRTLDMLFEEQKRKLPGYVNRLPDELRNKWIDPAAAQDVLGTLKFMADDTRMTQFYRKSLSFFRASKTAYNPATHVRNAFGAMVFAHLATGGRPRMIPKTGLRLWKEQGELYQEARQAGIIGGSFDAEIREALEGGYKTRLKGQKKLGNATAVDWMGESVVAEWVQKGASKAERFYRGIDEVWKLDAWARNVKKFEKAGMAGDAARLQATLQVNKYMPSFMSHSEMANVFRKAVPFSSFTTEALRVWKNAMIEKPHLAFFWNHSIAAMSQTFGAMAGFSPDQIIEAEKALPSYMRGKKSMMLPFNVDGQPTFVDMSYLIPLANLVEMEQSEKLFFELVDPTTNPFMNVAAAQSTGVDPFSERKIEPNFTERQLGIPVTGEKTRKLVGIAEHALQMMLPPLVPPGYAGTNLLELARGQKHPKSGEKMEESALRTLAANIGGIRTYSPTVESQAMNVKYEARRIQKRMGHAWKRWEWARANGKITQMQEEKARIVGLREAGGHTDAADYFAKSVKRRQPYASLSTKQLKEVLTRAEKLGQMNERDERVRAELYSRYQARTNK